MRVKRALSPLERALWKTDLAAPLNFTTIAKVEGPLSDAALRAGLQQLQARHPHLRERIEDGHFVEDEGLRLELRTSEASWEHEVERELNAHITQSLARFVKASPLPRRGEGQGEGSRTTHLLITLHHSIGDGMSGVLLMRDWLRAASGAQLDALEDPGAVDHLLPKTPGIAAQARLLGDDAWRMVKSGRVLRLRRDVHRYAYERRVRVTPVVLERELVSALTGRARAERTTVHGALSAAMLLGLLHDAGRAKAGAMFGSPVNLRATVGAGEALGFYVSMLSFRGALRASASLWEVAREVRRSIDGHLARKADVSMLKLLPFMWDLIDGDEIAPRALVEGWEKVLPTTSGLTNLGRLAVETQYGAVRLEELHFAANPSALGEFLATATSLHGRLFWNFIWPSPVLTDEHAGALIDDVVSRLRAAV